MELNPIHVCLRESDEQKASRLGFEDVFEDEEGIVLEKEQTEDTMIDIAFTPDAVIMMLMRPYKYLKEDALMHVIGATHNGINYHLWTDNSLKAAADQLFKEEEATIGGKTFFKSLIDMGIIHEGDSDTQIARTLANELIIYAKTEMYHIQKELEEQEEEQKEAAVV